MKYQHPTNPAVVVFSRDLAETFSKLMREALTVEEFEAVNIRNFSHHYRKRSCASHDFIDANEVMIEALSEHGITDINTADFALTDLINAAWLHAKRHHFQPWEGLPVMPFENLGQALRKSHFDLMNETMEAYKLAEPPLAAYDNLPPCYAAAEVMLDVLKQALAVVTDPDADEFSGRALERLLCETIEFATTDEVVEVPLIQ